MLFRTKRRVCAYCYERLDPANGIQPQAPEKPPDGRPVLCPFGPFLLKKV